MAVSVAFLGDPLLLLSLSLSLFSNRITAANSGNKDEMDTMFSASLSQSCWRASEPDDERRDWRRSLAERAAAGRHHDYGLRPF